MSKKLFLFSLVSLCFFRSFSQTIIAGKIVDSSDIGIPYADILLLDEEGNWTNDRTSSNENGDFKLSTNENGVFKISVISIGFEKYESDFFSLTPNKSIDLQTINLEQESFELNDVDVTARRKIAYKREIDRTIIDLETDSSTSGASLLDVLERTPGVIVDRQSESISMLGKSGVNVMINGKISYMPINALVQYLNGMNADNAKSIELITTPPANFDAEGNAGFINIELKKNPQEGYNGNVTLGNGFGDDKTIQNASSNFNLNTNKINMSFNYSLVNNLLPYNAVFNRSTYDEFFPEDVQYSWTRDNRRQVHNLRYSLVYDFTEKLESGFSVTGYSNNYKTKGESINEYSTRPNEIDFMNLNEDNYWKSFQIDSYISYKFSDEKKISFDFNYLKYLNDQPINYKITNSENSLLERNLLSKKNSPFNIKALMLDYEDKILKKINFSSGLKLIKSDFINENSLFEESQIVDFFTSTSKLDESVSAIYAQFDTNFGNNITFKSGIRFENTQTLVTNQIGDALVDRNYGNFFPSIYLGYKLNDNNNLNLSFSKRINRPAFTDLAPFVIFFDLDSGIQGNTSLQPSFTDNYQIDYRFKSISISAQYAYEKDVMGKFQPKFLEENGFLILRPENLDSQKTLSAIINFPIYPVNWWNIRFFTTYSYSNLVHQSEQYSLDRVNSSVIFNINNDITLGKDYTLQIFGSYRSRQLFGAYDLLPAGMLNLTLQKKTDNFIYTINAVNILDTNLFQWDSDIPGIKLVSTGFFDFSPPQIKFNIAYNFGNQNLKSKKIKASDQAKRIKIQGD